MVLNTDFFNGSGYRPLTPIEQAAATGYAAEVYRGLDVLHPFYVLVPSGEAIYASLADAETDPKGQHREGNTSILVHGHNAEYGINYLFPTGIGNLDEDFTTGEKRFEELEWYERSGVLITYPSNHPNELTPGATSASPKTRVENSQGIKDSVAAFSDLSSEFSNASGHIRESTLGITNPFIHYYENTYSQVYFPQGKTGPTDTRVNKYDTTKFKNRNPRDKSIQIIGSPVAKNERLYSTYTVRDVEEPDKKKEKGNDE